MRPLTEAEKGLLLKIAEKMKEPARTQLITDISLADVESTSANNEIVHFRLAGYERPPYEGQHTYPVEARLQDADGAEVGVMLYADQNDRLLELEYIRWGSLNLIAPKFETLEVWA